jgi:parallel beta-helix repeat protein
MTEGDVGSTGGPAICIFSGSPVVSRSTFRHNAGSSAGAIKVDFDSRAVIADNVISHNRSASGAILCAYGGEKGPRITGNTITDNTATIGAGGVLVWGSTPRIESNFIVNNHAPAGGGIYVQGSAPVIVNNTIALNTASGSGGGVYCEEGADPLLVNNILFGNRAPAGAQLYVEDRSCTLFVHSCDVEGGLEGIGGPGGGTSFAGIYENNIDGDPRFLDSSSGDFRLSDHSWCIGAGTDSIEVDGAWLHAPAADQTGSVRPHPPGSRPDIGAWEHPRGLPLSLLSIAPSRHDFQNVHPGSVSDTFEVRIRNRGEADHEIHSVSLERTEFRLTSIPMLPCPLPSQGEIPLRVVFRPVTPGEVVGDMLLITTSDTLAARVPVALRGRGSGPIQAARPEVLYGVSSQSGLIQLHEIERGTGKRKWTETFSPSPPPGLSAVTVRPADSSLCAAFSSGERTELYRLSSRWGDLEPLRTIPLGGVTSLAFIADDRLFVATSGGTLYRVGAGGDTVLVGKSGYAFTGLAFSPATGQLWASIHDTLCTVDTATGGVTSIGWSGFPVGSSSIAFSSFGVLYGLYDNTLVVIERTGGWASPIGLTDVPGLRAIAMRSDVVAGTGEPSLVPFRWTLEQNYPNPFNSATTIRYEIPEAIDVRLAVYDLLGREVMVLAEGRKTPGRYVAEFDASALASGVYFCRLHAGVRTLLRKMATVK